MQPLHHSLFVCASLALFSSLAPGATTTVSVSADGDVQTFGGTSLDTTGTLLTTTQSGGLVRNIAMEFDLGAIPEGQTITSVTLAMVKSGGWSNTSGLAAVHLVGYAGDGVVDVADYAAAGTNVGDFTVTVTPAPANGTELTFLFTDLTPVQDALDSASNLLSIRFETDNFATLNFASLENGTYAAPELRVTHLPEPGSFALMAAGVFATLLRRRRKD